MTGARTWGFGQVEMKTGLTVSGIGHVAVLAWCLVAFAAKPYESIVTESVPVDIISESQFSQLTAGSKNAPQTETPKPLVEKIGEKKPTEDPNSKIVDKKEITSSTDKEPPPPPPEPKQAKQADKKQAEPKRDLIAEALKKDEAKKPEPKKAEAKPPPLPKRPPTPQQPAFDPRQVQALIDKRVPQRLAATGDALSSSVSLGAPTSQAAQLSESELGRLRERLKRLWAPPAAKDPKELIVVVRFQLNRDGTLAGPPMVLNSGRSPVYMASRDSAMRAVFRGQPYDMLRPESYETWKDLEITFDPDMLAPN